MGANWQLSQIILVLMLMVARAERPCDRASKGAQTRC